MSNRKKKIFITGSSGFIGKNLVEQLKVDYEIFSPLSRQLDLTDAYEVKKYLMVNKPDFVLHCATHNATKVSDKDLSYVFKNNLKMFFNLVRCNNLYKRMFYFGSGAEYDTRNYIPNMKEDYFDTHVPIDDYGFSKYIMSKYIANSSNIYDLRLFGVYGKYEDWRIRFISQSICRALFNIDITINQNVSFDYLYIDDLVKIIRKFIESKDITFKHYNICSGNSIDLFSLAEMVIRISKKKLKIKIKEKGYKKEYSGNNKRLLGLIKNFEFFPHESAIAKLYEWYKKNKNMIDQKFI